MSPNINTSGLWLHDWSPDCYPARTRTRRDQQGVQPDERDGIQGHLEGPEDLGAHCQRTVPGTGKHIGAAHGGGEMGHRAGGGPPR